MSTWNPQANDIFLRALALSAARERQEYLDGACQDDAALRAEVEALLAAAHQAGSFLESPAVAPPALVATIERPIAERAGTVIGPYKLLEQIGEGGFGVVFMAEQTQPVRRRVALKVLKPGMDTRQVVARFEAERQALALMDHPNIAKVLDAGATDSGRPYFVMELVKGVPITELCDQNQLTPRERLELFIHVCQAVQHAHQKGIIHRDLKPSNILVVMHDTTPVVKVIDFGVAKALGQELTDKTLFTGFAQMVGTPLYMSPEQAGQSGLDVDTRSDIYSLGVLLYELMTGTTPFTKERFRAAGYDEIRRIIREEEPPKPSTRISTLGQAASTVSTNRKSDPRHLGRLLRGEVDWIVMKCLDKDRNRRYETANGLARDIERYLRDEPVHACPPSAWYRFHKFARRKKVALAMAACVFLALSGIAGGVGWAVRDNAAREEANKLDRLAREKALDLAVERSLEETGPLIDEGRWPEALAIVERTEQLLDAAGRTERPARLVELRKTLAVAQRLEGIYQGPMRGVRPRRRINTSPETTMFETQAPEEDLYDEAFFWGRRQDADFTKAFVDLGIDVETLSPANAADKIRRQSVRTALVRALDGWATFRKRSQGALRWRGEANSDWKKLIEIARQADADDWRNRCREALLRSDREALEELADAVPVRQTPPESLCLLGHALKEVGAVEKAMTFLERGRREYPGDLWLNDALAHFSWSACQPPRWDAALRYYAAVLALRPDFSPIHLAVADALKAKGATDEALLEYSKAVELEPKSDIVWTIRGNLYRSLARYDEAVADYSKATELEPTNASALEARIGALLEAGQYDKALADADKMAEVVQAMLSESPRDLKARRALGACYECLVRAHERAGRLAEAMQNLKLTDDLYAQLAAEFPMEIEYQSRPANIRLMLGPRFYQSGRVEEAATVFADAATRYEKLIAEIAEGVGAPSDGPVAADNDAWSRWYPHELGYALTWQGDLLRRLGRLSEAESVLTHALEVHEKLAAESYPSAKERLGWTESKIGDLRIASGDQIEAEQRYLKALHVLEGTPSTDTYRETCDALVNLYSNDGRVDAAIGVRRSALAACQRLVRERPDSNDRWRSLWNTSLALAEALKAAGRPEAAEEAIGVVRKTIALYKELHDRAPVDASLREELGHSLWQFARVLSSIAKRDDAELALRDALKVFEDLSSEYPQRPFFRQETAYTLRQLCELFRAAGRTADAKGALRRAIDLYGALVAEDPRAELYRKELEKTYLALGELADAAGRLDDAAAAYREAAEVWRKLAEDSPAVSQYGDEYAQWMVALANVYTKQGRFEQVGEVLTAGVEKSPNQAAAWRNRGELFARWGVFPEAAADLAHAYVLQEPGDSVQFFVHAMLRAYVGDAAGYRDACAQMLARFADSTKPDDWNNVAAALGISADSGVEPSRAVDFAERAVTENRIVWRVAYLGMAYYRAGEFQRAAAALEESLAINANYNRPWVYSALAMARHQLGNPEEAAAALMKARSAWDERVAAMLAGGLGHWPDGPWYDAVYAEWLYKEAHTLVQGSPPPEHPRCLVLRGRALEAVGREAEARTALHEAFALAPDDLMIRIQALPPISRADAYAQALADLRVFLKEHPQQPLAARLALAQRDLQWGGPQASAGQFQAAAEAFAEAATGFEAVIAGLATNANSATAGVPATTKDIAWYRHELGYVLTYGGDALRSLGRLSEAEAVLSRGLEVHKSLAGDESAPADAKSRLAWNQVELGMVCQARGSFREAEQNYRAAIILLEGLGKADYWLAGGYDALAQLCELEGRTAEAIEAQQKAVAAWEKQAREAIVAYTKGVEVAPTNPVLHNNLAWLYATCAVDELRDPAQAVALAKKAVDLRPTDGTSWNTLGAAQYRAGEWQAAVECLTKSMELRSGGDAFDWFFLAMAHWQLGQVDEAREWYKQAIEWVEKNSQSLSGKPQWADELRRFRSEAEGLLGK